MAGYSNLIELLLADDYSVVAALHAPMEVWQDARGGGLVAPPADHAALFARAQHEPLFAAHSWLAEG